LHILEKRGANNAVRDHIQVEKQYKRLQAKIHKYTLQYQKQNRDQIINSEVISRIMVIKNTTILLYIKRVTSGTKCQELCENIKFGRSLRLMKKSGNHVPQCQRQITGTTDTIRITLLRAVTHTQDKRAELF